MLDIDRYDELAALSHRLECGVGLLEVIGECMRLSMFSTDAYLGAVYAAREYLSDVSDALTRFKKSVEPPQS